MEHDCKDNWVNFRRINPLEKIFDESDVERSNERNESRFKLGSSINICINVCPFNFDVVDVVDKINSSR